jgi:hypothetical protein
MDADRPKWTQIGANGRKVEAQMTNDGYMLDTTEFNAIVEGKVDISAYAGMRLFATHIQLDELSNTRSEEKRTRLRAAFEKLGPDRLLTESAVWGISKWGESKWSSGDGMYDGMLALLRTLDKGKKPPENQHRDILIAETAIKWGLTLITGDCKLRKVTEKFGGKTTDPPRKSGSNSPIFC